MDFDLSPFRQAVAEIETSLKEARAALSSFSETARAAQRAFADAMSAIPQTQWRLPL